MYINIKEIKSRYHPQINGILHLGAHLGEEAQDYHEAGYHRVIWVEGNPSLVRGLKENVLKFPQNQVVNLLISDKDNAMVTFNVTEFSQSSSILELGITKEIHNTNIIERVSLTAHRIDTYFLNNKIEIDHCNFVNIDLQGYELIALKSMGTMIDKMDWVYSEVNVKSLYTNCALLYQMDIFLLQKGFVRVQIFMTTHFWGDALYQRKKIPSLEKYLRFSLIYLEEAGRQINDFVKSGYFKLKSIAKSIIKKMVCKK